jgi:non-ribosomal peptide synthetase-like protein
VLEIHTSMGDAAQLGHTSSLHPSQFVPAGQRWHGSPAQPTTIEFLSVPARPCSRRRRFWFGALQLFNVLVIALPGGFAVLGGLVAPRLVTSQLVDPTRGGFYLQMLAVTFVVYLGSIVLGLVAVLIVPRAIALTLEPGKAYPFYGFRYWAQRAVARLTNIRFFMYLFGDSSYIVHYLAALGYDLGRIQQTGSNFGVAQKHETPYLTSVGSGTMVSDGLSVMNADYSSTSFRTVPTAIGAGSFFGNNIAYPPGARVGDDCLLGTKVMVPLDGPVREGVGLLGSPSFEIPRSVDRDRRFDELKSRESLPGLLAAKNVHNTLTMGLFLAVQWLYLFGVATLVGVAAHLYDGLGVVVVAAISPAILVFSVSYLVLIERAATGFRPLRLQFCSIYDPIFWRHERLWKLSAGLYLALFNGTPFKALIWRALGVRMGRRVFDDGCAMPEKTLVTIGDDCTLNAGTTVQGHSLEDGAFKSGPITLGAGCTVGVSAFVHYGARMGDGAGIAADAFLMKGEQVAEGERWAGNPARPG